MNEYKLEYWGKNGKYKEEYVFWTCTGDRYILESSLPFGSGEYIVAYKK